MSQSRPVRFKSLWKKESNDKNALYVDITTDPDRFPLETFYRKNQETRSAEKDDNLSLQYRKNGNYDFACNNWHSAIKWYNKSLCFAENGSPNIGLAIGNRSHCFRKLNMFQKCLVDIDLALKCNYPEESMHILEARREECLKYINDGQEFVPHVPVLSFEPKDRFPSMANILNIEKNRKFGRHIKANADIAVGETVLVEEAYAHKVIIDQYVRCNVCRRLDTNLVACKDCTDDLFCYQECEGNRFHKIECNMKTMGTVEQISMFHLQIIRTVLVALATFPNIEQFVAFVEETIADDTLDIPESEPVDDRSKYRMFLKLWTNSTIENDMFNWRVFFLHKTLMRHSEFKKAFAPLKYQRFLMHLIGHHSAVIHYNARSSIQALTTSYTTELLPLIAAYFNHSCAPNVCTVICDNVVSAIAIRPIKKGEQLFISYFGRSLHRSTAARRQHFDAYFDFVCECERCRSLEPFVSSYDLGLIKWVLSNYHKCKFDFNDEKAIALFRDKCAEYARKHGRKLWTDEVTHVMDCFVHMIEHQFKYRLTL
ncbi:SET and MYND domain-containing protein DDB_G0273589-like [Bradysia coprophila]|uniref:SET and MYND domain-containing protein DDB_G0273589-like n=1 Tax=Bradysia coprophila TaxID=38358 RepID=UPI00187D91CA|nr:SET and MYND domain-containing protein DDB_G0273589-like [Bradysia coprophila]